MPEKVIVCLIVVISEDVELPVIAAVASSPGLSLCMKYLKVTHSDTYQGQHAVSKFTMPGKEYTAC